MSGRCRIWWKCCEVDLNAGDPSSVNTRKSRGGQGQPKRRLGAVGVLQPNNVNNLQEDTSQVKRSKE
jgi:hypothetical protein